MEVLYRKLSEEIDIITKEYCTLSLPFLGTSAYSLSGILVMVVRDIIDIMAIFLLFILDVENVV